MNIGSKIYFDKNTGVVLESTGDIQGAQKVPTIDDDFNSYITLKNRTRDSVGVIELEYSQFRNKFNTCVSYNIDITKNPIDASAIIFSFTPPEASLEQVKQVKIQELENDCTKVKDGGFTSKCLGESKSFSSSPEDRNLIMGLAMKASLLASGASLGDSTLDWKTADEPVCHPWQTQQIITLGVDMSTFLTNTIKHKEQLQQYVNSLTSIEEVEKVTWDTVIPTTTT